MSAENIRSTFGRRVAAATFVGLSLTSCASRSAEAVPAYMERTIGGATLNNDTQATIETSTPVLVLCQGEFNLRTQISEGPYAGLTTQSIPQNALTVPEGPDFGSRQLALLESLNDLALCGDSNSH